MKRKILFIDRDGTLIHEPSDHQIDSLEKLSFIPYVFSTLSKISESGEYELVMVTNQDGLGTDSFPEETFHPAQNKLLEAMANEGIRFNAIHIDRSFEYQNLPTRKPGIEMLRSYLDGSVNMEHSIVIGDRLTDLQLAKNLGCKAILINHNSQIATLPDSLKEILLGTTSDWKQVDTLLKKKRTGLIQRVTNETEVSIKLELDGTGNSKIQTGLGFFDHMLSQLAKHGGLDLEIEVKGDLHIDEHHTIEDTALALGEAFAQALGSKKGLARYGFCLPMDDCLAQVAIDFGGRPWLVWDASFKREKIGEMPTEMFLHFFKSFSDTSRCNLNIKAEGENEHHKIESIFKAFAKAIRMAIKIDGHELPTTKGIL